MLDDSASTTWLCKEFQLLTIWLVK